jgi:hypothetical protein
MTPMSSVPGAAQASDQGYQQPQAAPANFNMASFMGHGARGYRTNSRGNGARHIGTVEAGDGDRKRSRRRQPATR